MSFAHLHVHSVYSLLDGFSNIKKLVRRAKEMGMPALGLTDHGTMYGVIDFYNAAVREGIKPIIGVEAYMASRRMQDKDPNFDKDRFHLLLLAENETGYKNLLKICSAAQLDGFYYKPRIDHEFLAEHADGLICTTGCMSAEIPKALLRGNHEQARRKFDYYYEVFGPDHFFIELQEHDIEELPALNKALIALNKRYNVQYVATNDVHYVDKEDARLQDILLAIQTGRLLSDPTRMRMTDSSYHLRSPQEMEEIFGHLPGALSNTLAIAERCNLDLGFKGYRLPNFTVPEGYTPKSYLRKLCQDGLARRYGDATSSEEVQSRLDYELRVIHDMGFDAYFLIVWDLCRYASQNGIWYTARGSAAGSIVAYSLGITLVDPLEHGLIFERFLNPGRISMPDIDLDFQDDKRAEMMQYCADKYGHDKVAQIITFGTLKARAAVRDVGRVMDIPLGDVDRVAKLIPAIPGKPITIEGAIDEVQELQELYDSEEYVHDLLDTAKNMEGVVRSAGTHAAGVVVTDRPIIEYLPLNRPTSNTNDESPIQSVTQFEMSVIEELGLLKVDFLGLSTLTIMARACDLISERNGVDLNLHNIPVDDPLSFELMGRGETAGVFQVEGAGMSRYLMQMKPHNLDNVVAMIALYRPGPLEFIPTYIRRMHGEEVVSYRHPALETIFEETFGIPVYQEQIMRAAVDLAGYPAPEADGLRKAIAKKIKSKLLAHRAKFVDGATKNGVPKEIGNQIFDDWEEFARYGFNKSHAVAYGVIAVQTAYLKAHYPVEYMCALLSASKNDTDKVAQYVADCRRMNLEVLPPDINYSEWDFTIEDKPDGNAAIRFGMGAVKNVGHGPVETILIARQESLFVDIDDFARRVDLRQVGKRAFECLIRVGALGQFGSRAALLNSLDRIVAISASHFRAAEVGQMSLFGPQTGLVSKIRLPKVKEEMSRRELLDWERDLIGLYVSDHPLTPYMDQLSKIVTHYSSELPEAGNGEKVRVAGMVNRLRYITTKKGQSMAFATIEDIHGSVELVIFPKAWTQYRELVAKDNVIMVEGSIDTKSSEPKILVNKILTDYQDLVPATETATPSGIAEAGPLPTEQDTSEENPNNLSSPPPPDSPPDWHIYEVPLDDNDDTEPVESSSQEAGVHIERKSSVPLNSAIESQAEKVDLRETSPVSVEELAGLSNYQEAEPVHEGIPALVREIKSDVGDTPATPVEILVTSSPAANKSFLLSPESSEGNMHEQESARMITVTLKANGDKPRDSLRIQRIYGVMLSYPGNDRFALYLYEGKRSFLIEFPNFNTQICDELLTRLQEFVPPESIQIEPLVYP